MRQFIASLRGIARYSPSRSFEMDFPKREKETSRDYESRVWRERCHADNEGHLFIPPTAFKESLCSCARFIGMQIPGKGRSTYTKHFVSGLLVTEAIKLPVMKPDVLGEWLFLNADGRKGGSVRVWRCMPYVERWAGDLGIHVLDDSITAEVLRYHLEQAGAFVGVGRFRPEKGGFYGRYSLGELVET